MERILCNAFSLQMVKTEEGGEAVKIKIVEVSKTLVECELSKGFISAVGHADTAAVLTSMLNGIEVVMNRISVTMNSETRLFVAQITGGRLPEGAVTLPEGVTIKFFLVTLE
mgnify:FL=1